MRIWCLKNNYLITTRHNQGIITNHSPEDCVNCDKEECSLFKYTRGLSSHSIGLYLRWLGDSPSDIIAYNEGYDILNNTSLQEKEHSGLKLLYSLPPELYDEFWIQIYENKNLNYRNPLDSVLERVLIEYDNWDPLKPYWQNTSMRRKNG